MLSDEGRLHANRLYDKHAKLGRSLAAWRDARLKISHGTGQSPGYKNDLLSRVARMGDWRVTLPSWCQDQRNQMTGPADDIELVVKMINSGAPGVMLDLEDSMANTPPSVRLGIDNIIDALQGEALYAKPTGDPDVQFSLVPATGSPVILVRPRGLHITETVKLGGGSVQVPAALHDVIEVALGVDHSKLRHPLTFYIPKSESADEALWWRDLFRDIADAIGKPTDYIKCMALVEAHPLAYEMEEFIYNLHDHIMGLNLGRWDYMASLIHWNMEDPAWVLPDRNLIPHDVEFFQVLRSLLVHTCHKRGILALGGMTALFPDRGDAARNEQALRALSGDKHNEAMCGFDGAWTGHPDQNRIAVDAFPAPNQLDKPWSMATTRPDLRPALDRRPGQITLQGTRVAIRASILYRYGVLRGKGASLLGGYMEDLATDRIYRLMIAQRIKHWRQLAADGLWDPQEWAGPMEVWGVGLGDHSVPQIMGLFELESDNIIGELNAWNDTETVLLVKKAALQTVESILEGRFNPA